MSTFAQLSALGAGAGVAYLLEGSTNLFVTTHYAYSTHDGLFGAAVAYDQRIVEVGDLQRGFGVGGTLAASSVIVRLANADAGVDFLIISPGILFKVRWRLKIALYDVANPSDFATKTLGIFVNLDNPTRDSSSVRLSLADDSFGHGAELAIPPTGGEAFAAALDSTSTEPPCPIAMGGGVIPAIPRPYDADATTITYVLCATTDTADVSDAEVTGLEISGDTLSLGLGNLPINITRVATLWDASTNSTVSFTLWSIGKTASLTKDGRTWRVLYLTLLVGNLRAWLTGRGYLRPVTVEGFLAPVDVGQNYFNAQILPTLTVNAYGPRFSSITRADSSSGYTTTIRAPDIAYDLLRHYSRGLGAADVNQASFAAATAAFPMFFFRAAYYFGNFLTSVMSVSAGGALGRMQQRSVASVAQGILRRALSDLCQGGLFDVVTDWSGQFTAFVLANSFSLQTATPTPVDETLWKNPTDKVPSAGERWAPYNRVIFASNGFIVDNATAIAEWGTVLPRTINDAATEIARDISFSGADFGIGAFGALGTLESKVRPIVSFDYPLDALAWELGEFLGVTWSRGDSGLGVWASTVFRVEEMVLHPTRCAVSIKAVWIDDLADQLPYLLDDETLLVRSKGALTGACTTVGTTANFGGTINLATMGVAVGDMLLLRDTAEAAALFTRNLAARITAIPTATSITVAVAFANVGAVVNADWSIVRGATTYPTAVTDIANYPSGGLMYGKQSETGTFSGGATANVLQAG